MNKKDYNRAYYQTHKEYFKQKSRKYAHSLIGKARIYKWRHSIKGVEAIQKSRKIPKVSVLTHYGNGKCSCVKCRFSDIRALTIDHINGGGKQHRLEMKSWNLYRWLIENGYPEGYQTLCMNCQWIKRIENKEYGNKKITVTRD